MYKLTIFDYGDWKHNERCFHIEKDGKGVWASPSFPISATSKELLHVVEELEYACGTLGLILNQSNPSIYEWYLERDPDSRINQVNNDTYIDYNSFHKNLKVKKKR